MAECDSPDKADIPVARRHAAWMSNYCPSEKSTAGLHCNYA